MDTTDQVRDLAAPLVERLDAELYDIEYQGGVLRVSVDRPGGVDLDDIAELTRDLSHLLDEGDLIAGRYTLEVSSPGLERTLRRPEHFAGAVGDTVAVKLRAGVEGDRRVRGVLQEADDRGVTIDSGPGDPEGLRRIALDDIERARTVFEWGPAPRPAGSGTPAPSSRRKSHQQKTKKTKKKAGRS